MLSNTGCFDLRTPMKEYEELKSTNLHLNEKASQKNAIAKILSMP